MLDIKVIGLSYSDLFEKNDNTKHLNAIKYYILNDSKKKNYQATPEQKVIPQMKKKED